MTVEFSTILQGLMENRRLSPRVVSQASARAESTIRQLLSGRVTPHVEILRDISPILQISLTDLLVIAGLPAIGESDRPEEYPSAVEMGRLIAAASHLNPKQVEQLADAANKLREENQKRTEKA
ncbi:hypothetical protein GCM10011608_21360 [Micromonospora sonchi]|uniref:HTH cro/C1-type domain-containing protein n=1 Tax=Micromonospora sonchi TaxID=1763543 RepID=A0A917TSY2_9ACTN|nr:XRE family transcriptional regulator [Micromonospora sonchi]GGM36459.1 hypothetical protein GCM10011608_21360 [Micromonospora sonchi]